METAASIPRRRDGTDEPVSSGGHKLVGMLVLLPQADGPSVVGDLGQDSGNVRETHGSSDGDKYCKLHMRYETDETMERHDIASHCSV